MGLIHRSEITKERWINTSDLRTDDKEEFREKTKFGNRHAIFEKGALWGEVHYDKYNATDFPVGAVNHFAKYTEEKTGIPKGFVILVVVIVAVVIGIHVIKYLAKNVKM